MVAVVALELGVVQIMILFGLPMILKTAVPAGRTDHEQHKIVLE